MKLSPILFVRHSAIAMAVLCNLASAQVSPSVAPQADESQATLEEIVVNAQRREQRLQDVGISVTALSADDLREHGITESKEIVKSVPGVLLENPFGGGATNANLIVRGVAQTDTSPNQESPNSVYFDEVYLSSAGMAAFPIYDLARAEILRGPQGTLFGRASSGGLASFYSARPSREWNGYAEAGYGTFNDWYGEAAVGGPISERVRFRVAGRFQRSDGYRKNTLAGGHDGIQSDFAGVRAQIEVDVTDQLTARLALSYDGNPRTRMAGYVAKSSYLAPCAQCVDGVIPAELPADVDAWGTGPGNDLFGWRNTTGYKRTGFNDFGFLKKNRTSSSLYLTYRMGGAELNSITNYTKFKFDYGEDSDGGPFDIVNFTYGQDLKQYSQELRLNGDVGNLTYTAGAYYLNIKQDDPQEYNLVGFAGTPFAFHAQTDAIQKLKSWALFGQLEYKFAERFRATLGVRYTNEVKKFDSKAYFVEFGDFVDNFAFDPPLLVYDFSEATVGSLARKSEGLWSGKVQLDFKATDNALLYASVSRGVKAGGFNTNLSGFSDADFIARTPYKSEYLNAYEVGEKVQLLDNKLRINGSLFYYDYHRFEGYAFVGLQGIVSNYDGNFSGGELEISAVPTPTVGLNLAAAYLKATLNDVPTAFFGVTAQRPSQAPRWTVNGSASKKFRLPVGTLTALWDGNYIGERYSSVDNNPGNLIPGSFIHNARLSLNLENSGVEVAVFVKNIADKGRIGNRVDLTKSFGNWLESYSPSRLIGVSVRKSF